MKVLVVGSGGRDHAIAWKFSQSPRVKKLYVAHGNAGISQIAECVNARSVEEIVAFVTREKIDLTFVGPESWLSGGIVDLLEREGMDIVGPSKAASKLESSKCYAKLIMRELGIPVATFEIFEDPDKARDYVRSVGYPVVVKADGLAAGKGSLVCEDAAQAEEAVHLLMERRIFGDSGAKIEVEQRLYGRELSFFCFTDGHSVLPMAAAQDYKRARDNDEGKNTGGMGAYSPHPWLTEEMSQTIMNRVVLPLVTGFREKTGIVYKGIIYAGLMLVEEKDGITPYVLEINIRSGDPEDQVILPRLENDLVDISEAIIQGRLHEITPAWNPDYRLCIIAVSGRTRGKKGWYRGYPERYKIGVPISGVDNIDPECLVFHSGTGFGEDGQLITTGGRVLGVVSRGNTLEEARETGYREMAKVHFEGIYYRTDIGRE
ncbi:MAG: phosphoribosylamine--glycine ligase [Syntrophobacteria bacterium]